MDMKYPKQIFTFGNTANIKSTYYSSPSLSFSTDHFGLIAHPDSLLRIQLYESTYTLISRLKHCYVTILF
jgi:hypothetical protein